MYLFYALRQKCEDNKYSIGKKENDSNRTSVEYITHTRSRTGMRRKIFLQSKQKQCRIVVCVIIGEVCLHLVLSTFFCDL